MVRDTSFVLDNINMSLVTQKEKTDIYELLKYYNITLVQISPAQKLVLHNVDNLVLPVLQKEINLICNLDNPSNSVTKTYIQSLRCCPGSEMCKYAVLDCRQLGRKISRLSFSVPFPGKVKISISSCSMCCTEPYVRDIGILANRKGWKILFGGNAGRKPRIADLIAENLSEEKTVNIVKKILNYYINNASRKQRTARFVEKYGIDIIKKIIL